MREGCLHATPPSQETGEVRNLDFRVCFTNPELTGFQGLYLQTLNWKRSRQPSTPAR